MPSTFEQDTPKATVTNIQYVRCLSETLQRILAPLEICTCFRPYHTHCGTHWSGWRIVPTNYGNELVRSTDPLWLMLKSVHCSNRQESGAPPERTQEGSDVRKHSSVSGSATCSWPDAWEELEGSRSSQFPILLLSEMCIESLAHLYEASDDKLQRGLLPAEYYYY